MTKKDGEITEDIKREGEASLPNSADKPDAPQEETEIKNAHASGLGSMGRSDEKIAKEKGEEEGKVY